MLSTRPLSRSLPWQPSVLGASSNGAAVLTLCTRRRHGVPNLTVNSFGQPALRRSHASFAREHVVVALSDPDFWGFLVREHLAHARDVAGPGPSLTIYNQQFGVVRQPISLNLKEGANQFNVNDITGHLEPDSVILRSLDGRQLKILEQNYRNDAITQQLLLSLYEGKTIDFITPEKQMVRGKSFAAALCRTRRVRTRCMVKLTTRLKWLTRKPAAESRSLK